MHQRFSANTRPVRISSMSSPASGAPALGRRHAIRQDMRHLPPLRENGTNSLNSMSSPACGAPALGRRHAIRHEQHHQPPLRATGARSLNSMSSFFGIPGGVLKHGNSALTRDCVEHILSPRAPMAMIIGASCSSQSGLCEHAWVHMPISRQNSLSEHVWVHM